MIENRLNIEDRIEALEGRIGEQVPKGEIVRKKLCPFKFLRPADGRDGICEEEHCALWEEWTGHCGLVSIALLQGFELARQERRKAFEDSR